MGLTNGAWVWVFEDCVFRPSIIESPSQRCADCGRYAEQHSGWGYIDGGGI